MNSTSSDTNRVRLMELATIFAIGGTERQLVELANGLDETRFDLQLACLHREGPLLAKLKRGRIPTEFPIQHLYGVAAMRQQLRLAMNLWKSGTQVFHAQGFYPNVFGIPAARAARTPVVIASVRDLGDRRSYFQSLAQRLTCKLADAVVVNAEVVKRQLVGEGWSEKKIHVIHNGVDLSQFSESAKSIDARRELQLPTEGPLVAVVSRLGPQKGIEQFIDSAPMIANRFPNARFLVVGDAEPGDAGKRYRAQLEARALRLGLCRKMVFTGFRLDVPRILGQVTVAVSPSLSEATSNSLLESMASGAPVVATNVGGNPDVVEDNITGLLVPPSDPSALALAIGRLLDWPAERERLGEAGRRFVRQNFSLEQMVRNTEQLYLTLLEHSTRRQPIRVGSQREHAFHS